MPANSQNNPSLRKVIIIFLICLLKSSLLTLSPYYGRTTWWYFKIFQIIICLKLWALHRGMEFHEIITQGANAVYFVYLFFKMLNWKSLWNNPIFINIPCLVLEFCLCPYPFSPPCGHDLKKPRTRQQNERNQKSWRINWSPLTFTSFSIIK